MRVEDANDLRDTARDAIRHPGPVLLDMVTDPEEISAPGTFAPGQAWGFAAVRVCETVLSQGNA